MNILKRYQNASKMPYAQVLKAKSPTLSNSVDADMCGP